MRTSQTNRYARWAAIISALLAVAVFGVYLRRSRQARDAEKNGSAQVPSSIEKTSQGFSYTQFGGQGRPLFTIHASNATEYKEGNRSVLLDVEIDIFGRKGDRADTIHTHSCDYLKADDRIVCAGEVQMDLESANEAHRLAAIPAGSAANSRVVHVVTQGVTFDRASGDSWTDAPVQFQFRGGEGRAVGANYGSTDGDLTLRRDVHLSLRVTPPQDKLAQNKGAQRPPSSTPSSPVEISGTSLEFHRTTHIVLLHGPAVIRQETRPAVENVANTDATQARLGSRELHASSVTLTLDDQMRARHAVANGDSKSRPEIVATSPKGTGTLTADQIVTDLAAESWIEKLSAIGNAQGNFKAQATNEMDHVSAAQLVAEMVPKINQPRKVTANGAVRMDSNRGGKNQTIETAALELDLVPGIPKHPGAKPSYHADRARTLAPATLTSQEPAPRQESAQASAQQIVTHATGQRVEVVFDERSRFRQLTAQGGTELERDLPGKPRQTSTSQNLAAEFDPKGQWTTIDQTGNVHLSQGDRSGQAAHAHADRATSLMTLTGSAEASDAASHTTAETIQFNQATNEIRGDGHVLTTYKKGAGNAAPNAGARGGNGIGTSQASGAGMSPNFGADPAHITAEHLVGNSSTGRALYTGHARLWQGDSTLEADEIELNRDARELDARGNVHAVFIQVESSSGARTPFSPQGRRGASTASTAHQATGSSSATPPRPEAWTIRSGTLTYWDAKSQAHLDKNFTAESQDGTISGRTGELYFAPFTQPAQPGTGPTERLDHAVAAGDVVVRQGDRHATGERADYDAAAGKFVISGGNPTLYDTLGNSTRGRQLTFFLADDTILVESDEGSRTLTRYRVQK